MAEFKLNRFKYIWKGPWQNGLSYNRDDIVRVNGVTYVCVITHTASDSFRDDLYAILPGSSPPQPAPKWVVMTSSRSFVGSYIVSREYNVGDIVLYDGVLWVCNTAHLSTGDPSQVSYWNSLAENISFTGNWTGSTVYGPGAIVKYNGINYKCLNNHLSGATLEANNDDWEVFTEGKQYRGDWSTSTEYRKNDLVKYGSTIFRCTETHTANTPDLDLTKFVLEFPGTEANGEWAEDTYYQQGDVVRYGGYVYYAIENNYNVRPDREPNWIILAKTAHFAGDWSIDGSYKTGDVVLRGGYLYLAKQDINVADANDGSTLDYLDESNWEILTSGQNWRGAWNTGIYYSLGDIVVHLGSTYSCNFEHDSLSNNRPGDNGSGYEYWDLLIQAGQPGALHDKGDLITYGLAREFAGDGSTLGDVRHPIGEEDQLLSISTDLELFWRNQTTESDVIYVSTTGVDRPGYGFSLYKPFKTVRHACEYVEDNYEALTPIKILVTAGTYEEIGPIIVPAGTVVHGDELRSTIVKATPPIEAYQNDFQYVEQYIAHIGTFILDLVQNVAVTPTTGNTETQNFAGVVSNNTAAQRIVDLADEYMQFIDFRIGSGDTDPTMSGSNTPTPFIENEYAYDQLVINREFIAQECYAKLVELNPSVTFDSDRVLNDIRSLLRGIERDMRYSGNYGTLFAARRYSNAFTGSQLDDLFYMRDTTGLVSMTTDGLEGILNPPGVFELYQRPTGGTLVSLDPGWGPDDERVWIVNRSPFMQSVTNFGNACVGMKVDGSLHNGGNRSMVANDFTQILSDGIGAWVTNNARAELISIFTYYCAVGYLAEDGGVIRSANGNNSYGTYGSVADGNDPTETPQTAYVYNYNNQADVIQAFAGGNDDRVLLFEYGNAGTHYTNAAATIIGAGAGASVEYTDFRDGALMNPRLINTQGSGTEGGSNYLLRQGYAQVTASASSSIILGANDVTAALSEIDGMRITIISGNGVGQYGIVNSYDPVTKIVSVIKESDGTAGWDHVLAGSTIQSSLDSTAYYRIEPLITCNHPGFTSTTSTIPASKTWADVAFGGTTVLYSGLIGDPGTGATEGLESVTSTWRVLRTGEDYTVTVINPGAGYAEGDTITLEGTNLGGASPANDITITVTTITDDSTNSITSFTYEGTPRGGRFVAIDNTDTIIYSDNGTSWSSVTVTSGNYIRMVSGEDIFLAINNSGTSYIYSQTGETWIGRSFPSSASWSDIVYGGGKFVVTATGTDTVLYSSDGLTFTASTMPTSANWSNVAYGQGTFVAITSDASQDAATSTNGSSWTEQNGALPAGSTPWVKLVYGNNRFLAVASDGTTAYSLDKGVTWTAGGDASLGGNLTVTDVKYKQGVFFAIGTSTGGTIAATSEDGLLWTQRTMASSGDWGALGFATINNIPTWIVLADGTTTSSQVVTGARAKVHPKIEQGKFQNVLIWDPGSGYSDSNPITFTIVDNQYSVEAEIDGRLGNGVLAQPDFINRGSGYRTSSSTITITGNGYADVIPEEATLTISGVSVVPGPGAQIRISSIPDEATDDPDDSLLFVTTTVTDLGDDGTGNNTNLIEVTITPRLQNEYNLEHGTSLTIRSNYSQCRITGHDFLDIGTGNFENTNYPEIYAGGNYFIALPENEVLEQNGGRVFYTSTDQDGNFRAGELFSVQQSTGIVTISAEYFDLDGLSELALGGVRLGGSGTVINEFSTDPTFAADSNNVVPTQRAIATFLENRLSVGGENLEVNAIIAGVVKVGGEDNTIERVTNQYYYIPTDAEFSGTWDKTTVTGTVLSTHETSIQGSYVGMMMMLRQYDDTMQ